MSPEQTPAGRWYLLRWWGVLRWGLVVYFVILLALMIFEESLIFFPSRYPVGNWEPGGLKFEDAWFRASDGTQLHGWYVPHDRPLAVVLFCHGNGGNVTHRDDALHLLHRKAQVAVLAFDYRGYGRSEGSPTEAGVLADARAARTWLAQRAGIAENEIVMMGESLGGAVAVDLAARDGARALVLESTFSSLPDVASYYYRWLPVRLMMHTRLDSTRIIGQFRGPLLQSHSTSDSIIPYQFGRRLFDAAHEPKRLITFSGIDHNELRPTSYYATLQEFFEGLPEAASR
jgi:fermentation-respiration switch protein FrsA (DUF1100 family)